MLGKALQAQAGKRTCLGKPGRRRFRERMERRKGKIENGKKDPADRGL